MRQYAMTYPRDLQIWAMHLEVSVPGHAFGAELKSGRRTRIASAVTAARRFTNRVPFGANRSGAGTRCRQRQVSGLTYGSLPAGSRLACRRG